jgi:hypothetical protein
MKKPHYAIIIQIKLIKIQELVSKVLKERVSLQDKTYKNTRACLNCGLDPQSHDNQTAFFREFRVKRGMTGF